MEGNVTQIFCTDDSVFETPQLNFAYHPDKNRYLSFDNLSNRVPSFFGETEDAWVTTCAFRYQHVHGLFGMLNSLSTLNSAV